MAIAISSAWKIVVSLPRLRYCSEMMFLLEYIIMPAPANEFLTELSV